MTARVALGAILAAAFLFFATKQSSDIGFWIAFVLGLIGVGLLILGSIDRVRRSRVSDNITLFQDGPERVFPKRRGTSPAPWPAFLSTIGFLYAEILLLLVIPGILIFHFAWGYGRPHYGLYVLTNLSPMMRKFSCGTSWTVRIDDKENWYLNSTKTTDVELPTLLSQQLGKPTNCAVYLDVAASLNYYVAVHAIDVIQTTQAKAVVLLTPQTKKLSSQ